MDAEAERREEQRRTREVVLQLQKEGKSKIEIKQVLKARKRKRQVAPSNKGSGTAGVKRPRSEDAEKRKAAYEERQARKSARANGMNAEHGDGDRKSVQQPCFAFQRIGECKFGDDCTFSHDPNASSEGLVQGACFAFQRGQCHRGDKCRFSHSTAADESDNGRGVCYAFQNGQCFRGDQCRFAHTGSAATREEEEKAKYRDEKARKHDLVIIPILWKRNEAEAQRVRDAAQDLKNKLMKHRINTWIDQRTALTPAEKYGYWEEIGVRFRMELGPQEVSKGTTCLSVSAAPEELQARQKGEPRQLAERFKDMDTRVDGLHDILRILRGKGMTKIEIDDEDDEGCQACELIRQEEKDKPAPEPFTPSTPLVVNRKANMAPPSGKHTTFGDSDDEQEDYDAAERKKEMMKQSGDSLEGNWI